MIDLLIFTGILLAFFMWPTLPHNVWTVAGMATLYGVTLWWANRINLKIIKYATKKQSRKLTRNLN